MISVSPSLVLLTVQHVAFIHCAQQSDSSASVGIIVALIAVVDYKYNPLRFKDMATVKVKVRVKVKVSNFIVYDVA